MKKNIKELLEWTIKLAGGVVSIATFITKFGWLALIGLITSAGVIAATLV